MKRYKIPIQEEVRVWQNVIVDLYTDDSKEDIYKSIQEGDFLHKYGFDDVLHEEFMMETIENIQWDYENTKLEDIEEIEDVV